MASGQTVSQGGLTWDATHCPRPYWLEDGERYQCYGVHLLYGQLVPVVLFVDEAAEVLSAPLPDRIPPIHDTNCLTMRDFPTAEDGFVCMVSFTGEVRKVWLDVPAIQEQRLEHKKGEGFECGMQDWCIALDDMYMPHWSCQDKSRILETSEDGTKWCRKVQK